jgi:thiamine pyrophosphokinase
MKLKLTFAHARYLLKNLPASKAVTITVNDSNKILDKKYSTNEKIILYTSSKKYIL